MKTKRKSGPIPKPQEQKKLQRVTVFLTNADYLQLGQKAGRAGAVPAYIRAVALNAKPAPMPAHIPVGNLAAWAASAGLQNNLNQLVKRIHAEGLNDAEIEAARELVAGLRAALLKGDAV